MLQEVRKSSRAGEKLVLLEESFLSGTVFS